MKSKEQIENQLNALIDEQVSWLTDINEDEVTEDIKAYCIHEALKTNCKYHVLIWVLNDDSDEPL